MQASYQELRDPRNPSKRLRRFGYVDFQSAETWALRHPFDIVNRLLEEQDFAQREMSEKAAAGRRAAEIAAKLEDATVAMAGMRETAAAELAASERCTAEMAAQQERMAAEKAAADNHAAEMAAQLEERAAEIAALRGSAAAEKAAADNHAAEMAENRAVERAAEIAASRGSAAAEKAASDNHAAEMAEDRAVEQAAHRDGVTVEMAAATTRFYAAAEQSKAAPNPCVAGTEARLINLAEALAALDDGIAADRIAAEQRAADTATHLKDLVDELAATRRREEHDGRACRQHRAPQNKRARVRAPLKRTATETTAHSSLDASAPSSPHQRKSASRPAAGGAGARARRAARRRRARMQECEVAT